MTKRAILFTLALTAAAALVGCGSDKKSKARTGNLCEPAATEVKECTGDNKRFLVVSILDTVKEEKAGEAAGFDLDCRPDASCKCGTNTLPDGSKESACVDFTSPDGTGGIDNQFTRLDKEAGSLLDLGGRISENILEGDLILLVEVQNIDTAEITATTNDDCLVAEIYLGFVPGGGAPLLANGTIAEGQTFDIDERSIEDGVGLVRFNGRIENGKFIAGPADIPLSLPVGSATIDIEIRDGRLEASFDGDTLTDGLIGGIIDIEQLLGSVEAVPEYASLGGVLSPILKKYADMNGAGEKNECSAVSAGLSFDAVRAIRGSVGPKPKPADGGDDDGGDDAGDDGGN